MEFGNDYIHLMNLWTEIFQLKVQDHLDRFTVWL